MGDSRLSTVETWSRAAASERRSPTNTPRPPSVSWPASAATALDGLAASASASGMAASSSPTSAPAPETSTNRVSGSGRESTAGGVVLTDVDAPAGGGS